MEGRNVLCHCSNLLVVRGLGLLVGLHVRLKAGLHGRLQGQGLRTLRALLCRVLHHTLVVLLRVLFHGLCLSHLLVKILDKEVQHGDDTGAVGLLVVGAKGLRRRGRGFLAEEVGGDLREDRSIRGGSALGHVEPGVVELVEPVLRHHEQLLGGGVGRHQRGEVLMLRLPLLGCLGHSFVELLDCLLEDLDLIHGGANGLLSICDGSLQV
mmetsp:Transcript_61065/g.181953  ORF Transcript_61065/g.181953 Transcript_61065/m.181953 type:complete len:210 (-) Transcript_61065:716-1345(-)